MVVPHELAFKLHQLDRGIVHFARDAWIAIVVDVAEFFGKINFFVGHKRGSGIITC